jgi:ATP-binding cassette subfamily F protein 3
MLKRDNVLLMDEPTNHLDADSREVLEDALEDFPGTILAVSHDRYFINRFANRVAVLGRDGITVYRGNYDDYVRETERLKASGEAEEAFGGLTKTEALKEKRRLKAAREEKKALKARAEEAERRVAEIEGQLKEQEALMALEENYRSPERAQECARAYRRLKEELEKAYAEWEEAEEAAAESE